MPFKFAEIEGFDAELAAKLDADASVQAALTTYQTTQIEEGVTNRVDVAKGEFKQRMDAMDTKLKAAEEKAANAPDIDPEELKAYKLAAEKNPELTAQLTAMKKTTEDAEAALKVKADELTEMQRGHAINQAIAEYNTAHPTVAVKPDMQDVVSMLAGDSLRYDEEGKTFRVYNKSGDIVATDKGAATPVDWLTMLRSERPSLFTVPAGSGAPGSKSPGSAKKYAEMTEGERVALHKSDPAEFNRLRNTESGNHTAV